MRTEPKAFPLRLPISVRAEAMDLAKADGVSLNTFVALAVSEKIARMRLAQSLHASVPVSNKFSPS